MFTTRGNTAINSVLEALTVSATMILFRTLTGGRGCDRHTAHRKEPSRLFW